MLKDATPNDIAFIRSLQDRPGNLDKLESYSETQIAKAIAAPRTPIVIWHPGATPEGFAWLARDGARIKLEEFAVATTGTGSGTRFFTALLDDLRADPALDQIWLYVAADNAGAIRFYQRFGFARGETRPAVWHRRRGPVADALFMSLPL